MPAIAKIRFTNVVYDNGQKRFNDDIFRFDGNNGALILENGGGKTVLIQCAVQAVLPHADLGERKIRDTLSLDNHCCHIGIEWILNERPRRYAVTAVTLFKTPNGELSSYRFVNEYDPNDGQDLENMPFVKELPNFGKRPATKEEMAEYYTAMKNKLMTAQTFNTLEAYHTYLENNLKIIPSEWRNILAINKKEGGVEEFFNQCATTGALVDNLLIPSIEEVIAGNHEKDFAKTFEEQRQAFKEYRKLVRLTQECDAAIGKLGGYLSAYQKLHEKEVAFDSVKKEAKALYELIQKDQLDQEKQLKENMDSQQILKTEEKQLEFKQQSLKIAEMKQQYESKQQAFYQAQAEADEVRGQYREKSARKEAIELLKQKYEIAEVLAKIQTQEEVLKRLDAQTGTEELTELLSLNGQYLRGDYLKAEALTADKIELLKISMKQLAKEREELQQSYDETDKASRRLLQKIGEQEGLQKAGVQQMQNLARKILSNPKSQTVAEELIRYDQRIMQIEKDQQEWQTQLSKEEKAVIRIKEELPAVRHRQKELENAYTQIQSKLERLQQGRTELLERLRGRYRDFYGITQDTVYAKERWIKNTIALHLEEKTRQKEELMKEERFAKRMIDLYEDNPYFTADPSLIGILEQLANRFAYLKSGTEFVQETCRESKLSYEELLEAYPFWVAAVVVNDNELLRLRLELDKFKNKLNTNLFLLTYTQAVHMTNGENPKLEHIRPVFWDSNMEPVKFDLWKGELALSGGQAEEQRKNKELELSRLEKDQQAVERFFTDYPDAVYTKWEEQRIELRSSGEETGQRIKELETDLTQAEKAVDLAKAKVRELEDEYNHFMTNRALAKEYLAKEKENQELALSIHAAVKEKEELEKSAQKIRQALTGLDNRFKDNQERKAELEREMATIAYEPYYSEVKSLAGITGDKSRTALIEERKNLQAELEQKQSERRGVEQALAGFKKDLEDKEADFRRRQAAAQYHFDESQSFHPSMLWELDDLILKLAQIAPQLHQLEEKELGLKSDTDRKQAVYQEYLSNFNTSFGEPHEFLNPLAEAKAELKRTAAALNERKNLLRAAQDKIEADLAEANEAHRRTELLNARYHFVHIEPNLAYAKDNQYYYRRLQIVDDLGRNLESCEAQVKTEQNRINKEKEALIAGFYAEIGDVRFKEKIIESVERSTDYNSLKEAYLRNSETVDKTKLINQNYLKERENNLQQYVNQLYTHVERVAKELRVIPYKTKVKTETGTKEIFEIKVPVWDEKEAKKDIQTHIDWILERIEQQNNFKDEAGNENHGEIKKFLEKSLKTKQLFQKVFKTADIKVKVRKVTNDNQVSGRFYPWEESERWSGGERWSKNMTLFLGILNYIAEKRQANLTGARNNRVVILDNPFGKASSEHVLDPVFYIAKALGFQIIAVTAHAEGKFIHDYFPIVYSLKLREAESADTSIMTKTLTVKHAFFNDRSPAEIERLIKREQPVLEF